MKNKDDKKTRTYNLSPEVIEYIDDQAKRDDRTSSAYLNNLIKRIMETNPIVVQQAAG